MSVDMKVCETGTEARINVASTIARPSCARRLMFMYWGRRGFSRFVRELGQAAVDEGCTHTALSVSRQNESFSSFQDLGVSLITVDTFATNIGLLTNAWRIPLLRRNLVSRLQSEKIKAVIDLMPHAWSPFVASAIQRAGIPYIVVVHDAVGHPGDFPSNYVKPFVNSVIQRADHIITLSQTVAQSLVRKQNISSERVTILFHPDLEFANRCNIRKLATPQKQIRLLFLGRIMPYKGLSVFLDAVELLKARGIPAVPGVIGQGNLEAYKDRLSSLGAEVINRWVSEEEIGAALERYDALVAAHREASQSGVVAAALGANLPTVAMPVGALREQIRDGKTGVIASEIGVPALADAIQRLFYTANLYTNISENIMREHGERSMRRFFHECVRVACID